MNEVPSREPRVDATLTHFLYLMHALAPFTAWLLALVAVVIGMATRDKVRGTFLESHYSWLVRTFLWAVFWIVVCAILSVILSITIVGVVLVWLPWAILLLWYLYRVIRGWLTLNDGKPI